MSKRQIDQTTTILVGVCSRGPYKLEKENVLNKTVRWISWGYGEEYVHPEILDLIKAKSITKGTKALFCCWDLTREQQAELLREAVIDRKSVV